MICSFDLNRKESQRLSDFDFIFAEHESSYRLFSGFAGTYYHGLDDDCDIMNLEFHSRPPNQKETKDAIPWLCCSYNSNSTQAYFASDIMTGLFSKMPLNMSFRVICTNSLSSNIE